MSRALANESAKDLRRSKGWKSIRMSAYKVKPDPFWKTVRPVVPKDVIYGTFVTAKTYTTCFTGVVVPYVTGGAESLRAARLVYAASRLPQQVVSSS